MGNRQYISEICDPFDRTIQFNYLDTDGERTITVTGPDGSNIVLHTEAVTLWRNEQEYDVSYIPRQIVFSPAETITLEHSIETAEFQKYGIKDRGVNIFQYALLQAVDSSNGSGTRYEYESVKLKFAKKGDRDGFRITQRHTVSADPRFPKQNFSQYTYEGNYSHCGDADDYSYSTAVTRNSAQGQVRQEYIFNNNQECITQKTYTKGVLFGQIDTIYDSNGFPKTKTTTTYGPIIDHDEEGNAIHISMTVEENYEYDRGRLEKYASPKIKKGSSSQTTYSYNTYGVITQNSFSLASDARVSIRNTLTSNSKSIARSSISYKGRNVGVILYTYDKFGRVITQTDCLDLTEKTGVVKTFEYDGANLKKITISGMADADGTPLPNIELQYAYDTMGRLLSETNALGQVTAYTYDTRGRITSTVAPNGNTTRYIYDVAQNKTIMETDLRDSLIYQYNSLNKIETTVNGSGDILSEFFYDAYGRVIVEATGRGSSAANTAYYIYDILDRVVEKTVFGAQNTLVYRETYEYDDALDSSTSLVTKTIHGDTTAPSLITKTYTNKYGEVVKEDVGGIITEYAYDYVGNPIRVYYGDTTLATYTYDHNGNVLTEKNAAGDTRSITYDAIGRKIAESDFMGNVTTYTYDNAGRLLTMTAPLNDTTNAVTKYYYDANGNVTKQQQSAQADDSTEVVWRTVEQTYDVMNRVTDIKSYASDSEKQYTHYEYNLAGDLTDVYTGLSVPWQVAGNVEQYLSVQYTYDSRGNNTAITDALNKTETYEYDALGMLVSATHRDGKVTRYTYNAFGNVVSDAVYATASTQKPLSQKTTEYTLTGAVASVTMDGETVVYTYDGLGNVLTETEGNVVKAYTYDPRGRKSGYTLTIGDEVKSTAEYTYDDLDRLISVTEGGETTTYTYDKNGNRTGQQTGEVAVAYTYNKANLVTSMTNSMVNADGDSIVISSVAYTYYTDGNMRTKTETMLLDAPVTTTYVYDGMGRLLTETKGETSISYCYDANGNRTWMNNNGVITTYTYDDNNRLMTEGDITYTYDDNGNTTKAVTRLSDTHTFVFGVCSVCGDPETYMLGDANGDGEISMLDAVRIARLAVEESQTATYGLRPAQPLDSQDVDENGVVDIADYWLFLEVTIGYTPVLAAELSDAEPYDALADVDENGAVDTADYAAVWAEYIEPSKKIEKLVADVNGDGKITYDDATAVQNHHVSGCACGIGSMATNVTPCTSEKSYTYNARGQQIGYKESSSVEIAHTFVNGVCSVCGDAATYTLGDADGNGVINFLDFLVATRYYTDLPETLPPKDLDGDGAAGRKDYLIFAREVGGIDENYIPNPLIIDDLLAFADVDGNGEVGAADYLLAYATLYEKEISECLTNGISRKTSMQAADINGDGTVSEADKEIGIDFALTGSSTYPIGETVENTYPCVVAGNRILVSAQYAYNPSGLRSAKTVGGSTKYFVYNGMNIVYEYEDSISDGVVYCYGLNRTHNSDGEIYVYNAHGDTVQLVKDNAVVASYTYDAFGNLTSELCDNDNAFLYCSEYFDTETQTYYLRARYYNPAHGRFTQQDAWAFMDAADPLRLNLYTYCANNPVLYVDPSGYTFIPLRRTVENANGSVEWNYDTKEATVTVNGVTVVYSENDGKGTYIKNGKMYVDERIYNLEIYNTLGYVHHYGNSITKALYVQSSNESDGLLSSEAGIDNTGKSSKDSAGPSFNLFDLSAGLLEMEYAGAYVGGNMGTVNADIGTSIGVSGVDFSLMASLFDGGLNFAFPIPFLGRKIVFEYEVYLGGIGGSYTIDLKKGYKTSVAFIVGSGYGIYVE